MIIVRNKKEIFCGHCSQLLKILWVSSDYLLSASYLAADLAIDVLSHWAMVNGSSHSSAVANLLELGAGSPITDLDTNHRTRWNKPWNVCCFNTIQLWIPKRIILAIWHKICEWKYMKRCFNLENFLWKSTYISVTIKHSFQNLQYI